MGDLIRQVLVKGLMPVLAVLSWQACPAQEPPADAAVDVVVEKVDSLATGFGAAFDQAAVPELLECFAPQCEMIDEAGTMYVGKEEIGALLAGFFDRYPGARLSVNVETIRMLGDGLAMEEGTRSISVGGEAVAETTLRYLAVFSRIDGAWKISSIRDFPENVPARPADFLQPLAWLAGDWINEGSDARVDIHFGWSPDGNYLLGEYTVEAEGQPRQTTSQRIGWDPLRQQIRSWTFDSDGGFSEAFWAAAGDSWLIKSSAVLPDGQPASASLRITPTTADQFTMSGTDRVVGGGTDDDFEVVITRKPVAAGSR